MAAQIARIEISHHRLPLDPPFPAAWDSQPRRQFPATIVRVFDSEGRMGVGSGEPMYGFADFEYLFLGQDPLALERHHQVLQNVNFHAGRPWPLEIALWDLAGQIQGQPCWQMMGGHSRRLQVYISSGVHRRPDEVAMLAESLVAQGVPALKLRFGRPRLEDDLAVLALVRSRVGSALELMVDCNQAWRMPWDVQPAWDYARAREVAQELARYDVFWMEEPLHRGDYQGMARLRADGLLRIAGGELTRESHEFDTLLERDCLDVYQPDVAVTGGMLGLQQLAHRVAERGAIFTPHTWGNGIGLLANLHLCAGTVGAPFIEFPYDPPEWTIERRDFPLTTPVEVEPGGWVSLSDAPGLGLTLDEGRLAATAARGQQYV